MELQEKKLREFFEREQEMFDSWNGDFKGFSSNVRNQWRLYHQEEFTTLAAFIDDLTSDEQGKENASSDQATEDKQHQIILSAEVLSSGKVQRRSTKPVAVVKTEPVPDRTSILNRGDLSILPNYPEVNEPKRIDSLRDELDRLFNVWVRQVRYEKGGHIGENREVGKELLFQIESRAITDFYNDLGYYRKHIETEYRKQLWNKGRKYPRKWMLNDTQILKLLERYRIADVLNALEKHLFSPDGKQYKVENYKGKDVNYAYACFVTNNDFYKQILSEFKMKKITLQKYLTALYKVGAIERLEKTGDYETKNEILYAVGYYSDYNGKPKLNRFLTQKKMIPLRGFKI